jgi:hypothetical protein
MHVAADDFGEMRLDARGGDEALDERVVALLVGNYRDV